jgi:hypothetical protein
LNRALCHLNRHLHGDRGARPTPDTFEQKTPAAGDKKRPHGEQAEAGE